MTTQAGQAQSASALLVGAGFVGGAIGGELVRRGWSTESVARGGQHQLDLATSGGRAALRRLVTSRGYDLLLLCHGPSDVTWCEDHPDEAAQAHAGTAEAVADLGVRVILVSTDNVFPGAHAAYTAADPTDPGNAYGRVKLAAEQAVRRHGGQVARVSLVYGWSDGSRRRNFAETCLMELRAGHEIRVPYDQVLTPVYVDDVATVVADYATAVGAEQAVVHVAGPQALSRADFARLAARAAGMPEALVLPVPKAETSLACRPDFSGLTCGPFAPGGPLGAFRPLSPADGLAAMVAAVPG